MDFIKDIYNKSIPRFGYVVEKDNGIDIVVILGVSGVEKIGKYSFEDRIYQINKKMQSIYNQKEISENDKIQLIDFIKRQQEVVKKVKKHFNYKCQICGDTFLMDNGNYYCEAHHLVPLSLNGSQSPDNVIILCAKHHRMFHYAKESAKIEWEVTSSQNRNIFIDGKK